MSTLTFLKDEDKFSCCFSRDVKSTIIKGKRKSATGKLYFFFISAVMECLASVCSHNADKNLIQLHFNSRCVSSLSFISVHGTAIRFLISMILHDVRVMKAKPEEEEERTENYQIRVWWGENYQITFVHSIIIFVVLSRKCS